MDCLFCKIIRGELPSHKLYEDECAFAFLDIRPEAPGHALVIPKKHHRWVWDIPEIGPFFEVVQKVANAQRKAFGVEQIVSKIVGEEVPHAHVWLIPPKADGQTGHYYSYAEGEAEQIAEKLQQALGTH